MHRRKFRKRYDQNFRVHDVFYSIAFEVYSWEPVHVISHEILLARSSPERIRRAWRCYKFPLFVKRLFLYENRYDWFCTVNRKQHLAQRKPAKQSAGCWLCALRRLYNILNVFMKIVSQPSMTGDCVRMLRHSLRHLALGCLKLARTPEIRFPVLTNLLFRPSFVFHTNTRLLKPLFGILPWSLIYPVPSKYQTSPLETRFTFLPSVSDNNNRFSFHPSCKVEFLIRVD